MALEQAGISLVAENYNKYIKQLDKIDKAQQEVFNVDSSKLDKAFSNTSKSASKAKGGIGGLTSGLASIGSVATVATAGMAAVGAAALGAVAGVGALGASIFTLAQDTETATNQIAASLGISAAEAADKYGQALENIYAQNPDAQFNQIAEAITLTGRALDGLSSEGVEQVADDALKISQQFGQDLPATIGATEQLIEQFGLTSQQATDLLTTGLQTIPADDLIDSISEYSNQFAQAGFTAEQFFSTLSSGTAGGVLGTDKAADAVKEFQLNFIEGNDQIKESFATLGLSYDAYRQAVDSGQISIADTFSAVVQSAGQVDLSISSNRAAIAGLGSQFEDLGAQAIASLDTTGQGFTNVEGAADKLDERFNTLGGAFTQIGREFILAFKPIGDTILELVNGAIPLIKGAFDSIQPEIAAFAQGASSVIQGFAQGVSGIFSSIADRLRPLIQAFQERLVPVIERGREAFAKIGAAISRIVAPLDAVVKNTGASSIAFGLFEKGLEIAEVAINNVVTAIEAIARVIEFVEPAFTKVATTATQAFAFIKAGGAALGSILGDVFSKAIESLGALGRAFIKFVSLDFGGAIDEAFSVKTLDISATLDKAGVAAIDAFKSVAMPAQQAATEVEALDSSIKDAGNTSQSTNLDEPFDDLSGAIPPAIQNIEAYENAVKQAQDLQRSFAREAEDNARKLARANEDIARNQAKQVADLEGKQAQDRDKLLQDQAKKLDDFEKDRRKQIAKAEGDIAQARKDAAEQQKRDQQKLQRELQQAQDKFNLNRLQSERRFNLQESRLIAEGDVLGLKELREDFALQQQEEKENFDQSRKEQIDSASEQQKEQQQDLEKKLKELKTNLEDQRAELLASFDEQLRDQQEAQAQARADQQRGFEEQAAERAIQLAREEEDRRISQARQLEDLGRSLAEQQGVTAEGSLAIAGELEKIFGIEGAASNIMTGFTEKTENEFTDLFANLEKIVSGADLDIKAPEIKKPTSSPAATLPTTGGGFGSRIGGVSEFADGGIVPGPTGSPQLIMAHGGETVLPTHKQSMAMTAPVIPGQSLSVAMSGGFDIRGGEGAGQAAVQAAVAEMTENFRIAVQRLARRN